MRISSLQFLRASTPWPSSFSFSPIAMLASQGARTASSAAAAAPARASSRALAGSSHRQRRASTLSVRRRLAAEQIVVVFAPRAGSGGDGVSDLLARDKRAAGLLESDFEEMPAEFVVQEGDEEEKNKKEKKKSSQSSSTSTSSSSDASASSSSAATATATAEVPAGLDGTVPLTCAQAIDAGEAALRSGNAPLALRLFEAALDLPGSAAVRLAGSPREYSCASDAEAAAALYNMACAYVALGELEPALTCLEGAVEGGGKEIAEAARSDADLAALRESSSSRNFETALRKGVEAFENPVAGDGGGPAGVLGGLAARLLRRENKGGGRDAGTVAGRSVGVLERIMRPW